MLHDVFYYGKKPNVHPREKFAKSLEDARNQSTTDHFWIINEFCDYRGFDWDFDFELLPDEDVWAGEYNNVWPSQHQKDSGTWLCPKKYNDIVIYRGDVEPVKRKKEITSNWKILQNIDKTKFDFSWHPDPTDPPYIYVFGNQWYDARTEPTIEYYVPGATDKKYIDDIIALVAPNTNNWKINFEIDGFDYSWHPNPHSPPYIYVFGNQWYDAVTEPAVEYHTPGSDQQNIIVVNLEKVVNKKTLNYPKYYISTTLDDLIAEHTDEIFWALRKNINYDNFDFDWRPTKDNVFHINVFGSPDSETTQTYFVNTKMVKEGYSNLNFIDSKKIDDEYLSSLFKPMDMFYIDRGNKESTDRYEKLKIEFPKLQKTRFLNTWVDTINRCLNKCNTELCWILNSELDYSEFDFKFYPNPWQMKMVHVFGTQWSHWGTTFVVNKETFPIDTKYVKTIEHLSSINFVKKSKAKATNHLHEVYFVDHGNENSATIKKYLESNNLVVHNVNYEIDYLHTLKKIVESIPIRKNHYIWICSSICKYDNFDFTYLCDPFTLNQLHVFPSDKQKFGDTFFVDVNELRLWINTLNKLSDFKKINFNNSFRLERLPAPTIITDNDTHTDFAKHDFDFPYAIFLTADDKNMMFKDEEPMSLWSKESKNIIVSSEGATRVVIPKEASTIVKKELYDYPYIVKSNKLKKSPPLDIIFLSNGEPIAHKNYMHLKKLLSDKKASNKLVWVKDINGRVNSQHAAANSSTTNWYFLVNGKIQVSNDFNWDWQPDRLQEAKHYIFNVSNPVNGLYYGHQAIVANNKKITLQTVASGLDFTMSGPHEVVDMDCGVALYNTDPWTTWRTAFRESIKLRAENSEISNNRLSKWLTISNGDYGEYSVKGANDGVKYFDEVNGDLEKLKLSYEWDWLKERYKHDNT